MFSINPIKDKVIRLESRVPAINEKTSAAELLAIRAILKDISKDALKLNGELYRFKRPKPTPAPKPAPTPTPTPSPTTELYVPETQASRFAAQNPNHPNVHLIKKIGEQPTGEWLGEWSGNVFDAVKSYQDRAGSKLAVYVAYNIPGRDNGNYSAGGLHSPAEYYSWIGSIRAAIGDRKAWIILEPDAIGLSTALDSQKQTERLEMIRIAVDILKKQPNTRVYLDASMWHSPEFNAELLRRAGVAKADGFSVNVSGYKRTEECTAYAEKLSSLLGGKHYVIDTSRNGNGEWQTTEKDPWANPPGRALGITPRLNVNERCDAYLWIKRPGESDGAIRGYPSAGTFVPEIAIELAKNANW